MLRTYGRRAYAANCTQNTIKALPNVYVLSFFFVCMRADMKVHCRFRRAQQTKRIVVGVNAVYIAYIYFAMPST